MATNWTSQQTDAIRARGDTVLVSAAAGSGKTAVLVERILRRIMDPDHPCDIDRFLIVTFTNAAAAEMKTKISQEIYARLAREPGDKHLIRQMSLIGRAKISTIHAFCLELLRANFHLLGLSPDFRVGSETEVELIRQNALRQTVEEFYAREDGGRFLRAVEMFSGNRSDERLLSVVERIRRATEAFPEPLRWLTEQLGALGEAAGRPLFDTVWGQELRDRALSGCLHYIRLYDRLLREIEACEPVRNAYFAAFSDDRAFLLRLRDRLETGVWDDARNLLSGYGFERLGALRKFEDAAFKERLMQSRDDYKDFVAELFEKFFFAEESELSADFTRLYEPLSAVFELVAACERRFSEEKKRLSLVDFSDIEHLTYRLLVERVENGSPVPTRAAEEISEGYEEILIDEYQDTNQVQDLIFRAISRKERNLFMVGDVKQSIYRFRQAMPEIFLEKKNQFGDYDGGELEAPARITLGRNFRSRRTVLDMVNFCMGRLFSPQLGEMAYDGGEALYFGAPYDGQDPPVEVDVLETDREEDEGPTLPKVELEARFVARRILELRETERIFDRKLGDYRPLRWDDVVILLRSPGNRAAVFERLLGERGIPAFTDSGRGFLQSAEVSTMLSLLRVLNNPLEDIHLIAVMDSPLFGFSPERLSQIRAMAGGGYYDAVQAAADAGQEDCASFLRKLSEYRLLSVNLPVDRLIWLLYGETGYLSVAGAMPDGGLRQANLRLLYDYARRFEQTGFKGLYHFNSYISRVAEAGGDLEAARVLSENSNVVRIMSIHKAKGLEFPVCILAGCSTRFNLEDLNRPVLLHGKLGLGCRLRDTEKMAEYETVTRRALQLRLEQEQLSEELRTLYVAMTRAKERLIVTMAMKNVPSQLSRLSMLLGEGGPEAYPLLRCKSYAEWLLLCLLQHPQGTALREAAGSEYTPEAGDAGGLTIRILAEEEEAAAGETAVEEEQGEAVDTEALYRLLSRRLDFQYPNPELSSVPAKLTVTEIRDRLLEREEPLQTENPPIAKRPAFLEEEGRLTPAEKGLALHSFLQFAELQGLEDEAAVRAEAVRLVEQRFITPAQSEALDAKQVLAFTQSELFRRMSDPGRLKRELRYTLLVPARELYARELPPEETVLLQGVIDCAYEEEDGYILVDYKTDRTTDGDGLVRKYEPQLTLYARALLEMTGKPVKERYIFSFYLGKALPVPETV